MEKTTNDLFSKIANRINFENYFYLILVSKSVSTSGLYPLENNSISYSNQTVELFKEFSDQFREKIKGTGITILFKTNSQNYDIKRIPWYNPELFNVDLFELIIFQEFGFKSSKEERIKVLEESLKKEKIKETLVYACYTNDTDEILSRTKTAKKTQLNRKLEYTGTPLGLCAINNNLEGFRAIADKGADVNKRSLGTSPLQLAFKYSIDIVKYIFNSHREAFDKEFHKKGFYLAADCTDREILDLLKRIGGDLGSYDISFPHLHNFTDRNNLTGIEFCLDNNIDVNMKDKQQRTALNKAIMRGHKESINLLRKHGGLE